MSKAIGCMAIIVGLIVEFAAFYVTALAALSEGGNIIPFIVCFIAIYIFNSLVVVGLV